MLLLPQEAETFFKLYPALMCFADQRLKVLPTQLQSPDEFGLLPVQDRLTLRDAFLEEIDLIETFVDDNPFAFSDKELEIALSWRHLVAGRFYIFRQLKKCAIFLSTDEPWAVYGVVALTDPFEAFFGSHLPVLIETALLPFQEKIIYDGLLRSFNISFGPGIRRSLNERYSKAKGRQGIITSLPAEATPLPLAKPP